MEENRIINENEEKMVCEEVEQEKPNEKRSYYKNQLRGACLILFGVLLSCYDWYEVGFFYFADFAPFISLFCGVLGVVVAFSDSIKGLLNFLNEH